jgi:group I intron endonuclease
MSKYIPHPKKKIIPDAHSSNVLCWIYLLRNNTNIKVYVGQTWRSLKRRFSGYNDNQPHLYAAINKYGKENFYYEILTVVSTQEMADYWEDYFITKFNARDRHFGYNKTSVKGTRGKCSQETKDKISKANQGKKTRPLPQEQKDALSRMHSGEGNPASKITADIARKIYTAYHADLTASCDSLSTQYQINRTTVNDIARGKLWSNATKDLPSHRPKTNGKNWTRSKLTEAQVIEIKHKLATGKFTYVQIAKEYRISDGTISAIHKGKIWKHTLIDEGGTPFQKEP